MASDVFTLEVLRAAVAKLEEADRTRIARWGDIQARIDERYKEELSKLHRRRPVDLAPWHRELEAQRTAREGLEVMAVRDPGLSTPQLGAEASQASRPPQRG